MVAQKTRAALDAGLRVILCVGETLAEREAGETDVVVRAQLDPVVKVAKAEEWSRFVNICVLNPALLIKLFHISCSKIVIAYEPVWAIGTGKVASAAQAQEAHAGIRAYLTEKVSSAEAEGTRIIYGGSVAEKNCHELGEWVLRIRERRLT